MPCAACVVHFKDMAKKTTLKEIGDMLTHVVKHMATKDDIADLRRELKGDIFAVHTQVNSIETQLRGMNYPKLETRVTKLEEEVFGKPRGQILSPAEHPPLSPPPARLPRIPAEQPTASAPPVLSDEEKRQVMHDLAQSSNADIPIEKKEQVLTKTHSPTPTKDVLPREGVDTEPHGNCEGSARILEGHLTHFGRGEHHGFGGAGRCHSVRLSRRCVDSKVRPLHFGERADFNPRQTPRPWARTRADGARGRCPRRARSTHAPDGGR